MIYSMSKELRERNRRRDLILAKSPECSVANYYRNFFARNPFQTNPTDINTREKFDFAVEQNWFGFADMQAARKRGEPWTKLSWWLS